MASDYSFDGLSQLGEGSTALTLATEPGLTMASLHKDQTDGGGAQSAGRPAKRWALLRWFVSSATLGVPQAGGPIAFSLVALGLTGQTSGGAAMMLAMMLAQVVGAIPIARLGRSLP